MSEVTARLASLVVTCRPSVSHVASGASQHQTNAIKTSQDDWRISKSSKRKLARESSERATVTSTPIQRIWPRRGSFRQNRVDAVDETPPISAPAPNPQGTGTARKLKIKHHILLNATKHAVDHAHERSHGRRAVPDITYPRPPCQPDRDEINNGNNPLQCQRHMRNL